MSATTTKTCSYKGRTYLLLWSGATKYGQRAKLGFTDGSKEFWVDEAKISTAGASGGNRSSESTGHVCAECGRGGRLVADLEDGMMKHYGCCDIPPGGY